MADSKTTALSELTNPAFTDLLYGVDDPGGTPASRKILPERLLGLLPIAPGGRLTLTTAVPVTTSDVTAATTLYYALHAHNLVRLYDTGTSSWKWFTFTERSLSIPATTDTNHDIFLYNNAGTLTLEEIDWTNATTRATALARQDGVWTKNGDASRLYLGTIRTTGVSGQTEDSEAKRFIYNHYNQVERYMRVVDTTDSWTYNSATIRQARATATNQLAYVQGLSEQPLKARVLASADNAAANTAGFVGIGVDSTTVNSARLFHEHALTTTSTSRNAIVAEYAGYPGIGYHTLVWLEAARSGTFAFSGDLGTASVQSGIDGWIWA